MPVVGRWVGYRWWTRYVEGGGSTAMERARREALRLEAVELFEGGWGRLKTSLGDLAKHAVDYLDRLIRTRLKRIRHRLALITGILSRTPLPAFGNPAIEAL